MADPRRTWKHSFSPIQNNIKYVLSMLYNAAELLLLIAQRSFISCNSMAQAVVQAAVQLTGLY